MPELTREEKLKLIEKLPQRLQDFLYSEDTGAFLLYLGQKYNLSDEKVSALSKITSDIVLNLTPITSLAQEIANKVTADPQTAMAIAQELSSGLLMPALTPAPVASLIPQPNVGPPPSEKPAAPAPAQAPTPVPAAPAPYSTPPISKSPTIQPVSPAPQFTAGIDKYREPTTLGPEIVDLRKAPPVVSKVEPPLPINLKDFGGIKEMPVAPAPAYIPAPPPKPLTFTKPVEPARPLIEAEPHLPGKISGEILAGKMPPPTPPPPAVSQAEPQFIIRPPGLPPTDMPRNILDLRKDKGEF